MSHKEVYACLSKVVPTAHLAFPVENPHPCPFAAYYRDKLDGACADNTLYAPVSVWNVELHQAHRDVELEAALEAAIAETFGAYKIVGESWIEDDQHFMTVYSFSTVNKETNHV